MLGSVITGEDSVVVQVDVRFHVWQCGRICMCVWQCVYVCDSVYV